MIMMVGVNPCKPAFLALIVLSGTDGFGLLSGPPCTKGHSETLSTMWMAQESQTESASFDPSLLTMGRRTLLQRIPVAALGWTAAALRPAAVHAEYTDLPSIAPCPRSSSGDASSSTNCVSTASVRQLDQYLPPWTYNGMSRAEVVARLKGVIESDSNLSLIVDQPNYWKVQATRSFNVDEIELVFNDADEVITFRSIQVGGPSVSDFGANRSRLEAIRIKAQLGVMGQEYDLADPTSEGAFGQLKAFYGLQSGTGFEDINLDR